MRLIDADALKARIMVDVPGFLDGGSSITKAFILAMLGTRNATPTIDAVQVVRCKDCKYCGSEIRDGIKFAKCELKHNWMPQPDWFCADGIAKDTNVINK